MQYPLTFNFIHMYTLTNLSNKVVFGDLDL